MVENIPAAAVVVGMLFAVVCVVVPAKGELSLSSKGGGNRPGDRAEPSVAAFATTFALSSTAFFVLLALCASHAWAQDRQGGFGERQPGTSVYDRAGVLSTAELRDLQGQIRDLERSTGTPAVVYLREKRAGYGQTEDDARSLMSAWDVESSGGARDGLVVFLNVEPPANPDDPHGQVALYAGQKLADGPLPRGELQRISDEEVIPRLKEGEVVGGISAGLAAAREDIRRGAPPVGGPVGGPAGGPAHEEPPAIVAFLAGWPSVLVALVAGSGVALFASRIGRSVSRGLAARGPRTEPGPRTSPPEKLSPAAASRLAGLGTSHDRAEATILDLAGRGALLIEPEEPEDGGGGDARDAAERERPSFRVRLADEGRLEGAHEQALWRRLADRADRAGALRASALAGVSDRGGAVEEALREELQHRGLFDREAPRRREVLCWAAGGAAFLALLLGSLAISVRQPLGVVAVALLVGAAAYALYQALGLPEVTPEGERRRGAWRAYRDGIEAARNDASRPVDLDEATPYAVAFGVAGALEGRLEEASERGEAPAWLPAGTHRGRWEAGVRPGAGFYPYWGSFHGCCAPAPATGAGGAMLGGAGAAGAGGAGGAGAGGAGGGGGF